jgi:hypothetical protein
MTEENSSYLTRFLSRTPKISFSSRITGMANEFLPKTALR